MPLQGLSFDCSSEIGNQRVQALSSEAEIVRQVGRLTGLRTLNFSIWLDDDEEWVLDLTPLSSLLHLRMLKVDTGDFCDVEGVQSVLSSCQQLASLTLCAPHGCEEHP